MGAPEQNALPLPPAEVDAILEVARRLAAPIGLEAMLAAVIDAARRVLRADRGSVLIYDATAHELVLKVGTGLAPVRMPADRGLAGECVRTRQPINVPDCYADPRFSPEVDRRSGYRTRCMLTLPLVGLDGALVGVMQVLNKHDGCFDADDERLATALAAQCAVALERAQLLESRRASERLDREIAVAREIQLGALPDAMPALAGYEGAGLFRPTDQTGGDLFDFARLEDGRLLLLLGDATGHGIGPALSATQVRAMIRVGLRLGASLDEIFRHVNDQLVEDLPADRFVTAFLGMLDPRRHVVSFHAAGQGPLLHYRAASGTVAWHGPTTFPLGALPQTNLEPARELALEPGDVLGLISDGLYEYPGAGGEPFGEARVAETLREHHGRPMREAAESLLAAARRFAADGRQADDVTIVLVRRLPD